MKRASNLIEVAAEMESLERAYYLARRGKTFKKDVVAFSENLFKNLTLLRDEMLSCEIRPGGYQYFTVYDKKPRTICAAPFRDRVLHHALMGVCDPIFEGHQIYDSYASRRGKGTFAALDRARLYTRRYGWYFKMDVRKYFDSINHDILKGQLRRLFKDRRLLHILDSIIDSYETTSGSGVPIGNLTSQYFANHYLASVDRFARETLHVPGYIRYMDDMVLWSNDRTRLLDAGSRLIEYIEETLALCVKPFCFNRSSLGLPCLGFIVYPNKVRLDRQGKKRYRAGIASAYKGMITGELTQKQFSVRVASLSAHTEHADACGFRRQVLQEFGCHPKVRTASTVAAAGTTTPRIVGLQTATGTLPTIGT